MYHKCDFRVRECTNLMKCTVQGAYMNPRYRILTIGEEIYILDMGKSFWKVLFPFTFWIFTNVVYKVNNHGIIEKIAVPEVKKKKIAWNGLLAGSIGAIIANLLQPLVNFLDIESTPLISSIIVAIVFLITLSVFYYINFRSKTMMEQVVDLDQLVMKRLWIRPQSYKHFFFIFFAYLLFIMATIVSWGGFIQVAANPVILLIGMIFLFFTLFINLLTVGVGSTTVKCRND